MCWHSLAKRARACHLAPGSPAGRQLHGELLQAEPPSEEAGQRTQAPGTARLLDMQAHSSSVPRAASLLFERLQQYRQLGRDGDGRRTRQGLMPASSSAARGGSLCCSSARSHCCDMCTAVALVRAVAERLASPTSPRGEEANAVAANHFARRVVDREAGRAGDQAIGLGLERGKSGRCAQRAALPVWAARGRGLGQLRSTLSKNPTPRRLTLIFSCDSSLHLHMREQLSAMAVM
jgi:hypothetical protein